MKPEEHGRRWRERRVAQSRRDVELETFPTTAGSRALLSHPMFGAGRGTSPGGNQLGEIGETLTVKATSVAVSTTPTVVEFTATVGEAGGFQQVIENLPTDELTPAFPDSYYDIQVEIVRGAYAGTVAVEVMRGDTVVWGPTMSPYWANPQVPVSAKGRLTKEAT